MNQEKIGRFLSQLRKEQGMTQQQLADAIGVSNKTISKWECGKGMPEISSITPLCQTLKINVNELLSGERLPEDGYSKKAEENMMNLIHETEISKKKNKNSISIIFVILITVLLVGLTVVSSGGIGMSLMLLDWPTLLPMILVTIFFLLSTRLGGSFMQAFMMVTGKKKVISREELVQAKSALKLASNALLGMGVLETCVGFIAILSTSMMNAVIDGPYLLVIGSVAWDFVWCVWVFATVANSYETGGHELYGRQSIMPFLAPAHDTGYQ